MKKLFGFTILLVSLSASTYEIKVKKMSQDGDMERSFVLSTQLPDKVVLDCQSFIQGLRIGEYESAVTFMMDPFECESLQDRVLGSMRKYQPHCIDVDSDIRSDYPCR